LILARNVRQARKDRGWSQEQLAERASLSSVYVSQIESSLKAASIDVIEQLSIAFETAAEDLLRNRE
jgi:transcriptional regulator with XRE-family HTH domain